MPHATEGDLHAHLDGALAVIDESAAERLTAHLARCADCRARLEQERVLRDRAGDLLGVALPVVDAPPFETVVGSTRRRPPRMTTERLAWAAAIIVALGAGWIGNAVLRGVPDSFLASAVSLEPARVETESASPESQVVGGEGREGRLASNARLQQQSENAPERADKARATESADRSVDELMKDESDAPRAVGAAVAGAPTDFVSADARQMKDSTGSVAWREVDEGEATLWIERAPLRIEELDIVAYEIGELAGAKVLRVRQALPGGETVTLVQEMAPATSERDVALEDRQNEEESRFRGEQERDEIADSPSAAAAENPLAEREQAKQAHPMLSSRNFVNGVWVTLRAPLAPDSLRALVSRIR